MTREIESSAFPLIQTLLNITKLKSELKEPIIQVLKLERYPSLLSKPLKGRWTKLVTGNPISLTCEFRPFSFG